MERPMLQDSSVQLHFVDDRADTLLHMAQQPHLQRWNLYCATWCVRCLYLSLWQAYATCKNDMHTTRVHKRHSRPASWARRSLLCDRRGYSTEEQKQEAARAAPLIKSITLKQFEELLKWGMLSGVDDGCEPEEEEKRAATAAANARR